MQKKGGAAGAMLPAHYLSKPREGGGVGGGVVAYKDQACPPWPCVLVYPTCPACLISSFVLDILGADEWFVEGPVHASGSSEPDGELSDSSAQHSQETPCEEDRGSHIDGF